MSSNKRGRGRYGGNNRRDRSRSRSRSSRQNGGNNGNRDHSQPKKKKTLTDHVFGVGNVQDASEFITNSKFIIRHIQTTFEKSGDIATALKEQKHFDFTAVEPRLKISSKDKTTETAAYEQETAEFMKQYEIKIKSHVAREEKY